MKDFTQVIVKPLITERAASERVLNKYTFLVDKKASKAQIKEALERIFHVKVKKVNTAIIKGKPIKRWGRVIGHRSDRKKAMVTLFPGEKIEILEGLF